MNTPYTEMTYDMLKTYLVNTTNVFEKVDGEPGFFYRKSFADLSLVFCVRLDDGLGALLFNAYPGIYTQQCYIPLIADYCQRATPEVGVLCVEPDLCEIYYRAEALMNDAPISPATLEVLERTAFSVFAAHKAALSALGAGILPEALPAAEEIHIAPPAASHAEEYLPLMEDFFRSQNLNVLAKHEPDDFGECFLCEFITAHRRWMLHVTLNDEKTFFLFRLSPGRNALVFRPHSRHAAAQICNKENADIKTCALMFGTRPEGMYAKIAVSALEEVPSLDETLRMVLSLLVTTLNQNLNVLRKTAAGIPVELSDFDTDEETSKNPRSAVSDRLEKLESMQKLLALAARRKASNKKDESGEKAEKKEKSEKDQGENRGFIEIDDSDPNPAPLD